MAVVALISGVLVLLIDRYLGSGDWRWADALADFVKLFATAVVIVGLLDWYRRLRWRDAEAMDLRSLTLLGSLVATGWSSPMNTVPPDLSPAAVVRDLEEEAEKLAAASDRLDEVYRQLIGKGGLEGVLELSGQQSAFELYYAEGSRTRRLQYLSTLVHSHLPGLIERRDDSELFSLFAVLRDSVIQAGAAAHHADAVIYERLFLDRPEVLVPFLDAQNALPAFDPVAVFARAIDYATDVAVESEDQREELSAYVKDVSRCVGAVRNELQWVREALLALRKVICKLEDDILSAAYATTPLAGNHGREPGRA